MKKFTFLFIIAIAASLLLGSTAYGQIAQRGTATSGTSTNTSLLINKPTGVVTGDVMLVNIVKENNGTDNPTLAGWTLVDGGAINGGDIRGSVLYKVATGSEPASYTFALGANTNDAVGSIIAFSGVDVSGPNPFDGIGTMGLSLAGGATATAPAITTSFANSAVVMFAQQSDNRNYTGWTTTAPGALTEISEVEWTDGGDDLSVGAAWALKAGTGSTGSGTVTLEDNNDRWGAIMVGLKAAIVAPSVTLSPSTTQNIFSGGSVSFTATALNFPAGGNYTYDWTVSPAVTLPGADPNSIAAASDNKVIVFPNGGSYTVSVNITRVGTATNLTTASVIVNVSAPNLWSVSATDALRKYTMDPVTGALLAGPATVVTPLTSTAAVAKNQIIPGVDAEGCIYYLNRDDASSLNGVVTVYSLRPDGTGHASRGTIDMNGAGNDADFSFVRLGFDALGRGWILAGSGSNIYIASFQGNGVAGNISNINTFGNASLTVAAPGVATDFQNGDLAITANGTLYAVANVTDGETFVYTLNSLSTPTTLSRKWTVQQGGNTFSGSVNGLAWTQSGSLHFSTSTGIYFIDQFTANTASGTVQATLVAGTGGLGLTDLGSDKFPTQTTLPVDLISFTGSYFNQKTSLNWVTENLQDFDRFEIERSTNGNSFATIATKAPVQTTARTTYLHTDDLSAVSGTVFYYRLKMIDLNGQIKYSNIILVRKESNVKGIRINPNPVVSDGTATLRFEAAAKGVVEFRIVDMAGRVVLTQQNNVAEGINSVPVNNLKRLQAGTYVLQMNDGTTVQSTKFIIAQ